MTIDMWLTAAVLVALVGALARELVAPAAAVIGALVVLVVLVVVGPEDGFAGFLVVRHAHHRWAVRGRPHDP
jgi:hypothetical protein